MNGGEPVKRRHFIQTATACVLLPAAVKPCVVAFATVSQTRDYLFFDERFEKAHRIVASWPASSRAIPVHSDVTSLWSNGLDRMTRDAALHFRGVTTQSFLFCLRILTAEHADLEAQVSRLDRYLFEWAILTTPRNLNTEQRHG
jgi:hypothetical protein